MTKFVEQCVTRGWRPTGAVFALTLLVGCTIEAQGLTPLTTSDVLPRARHLTAAELEDVALVAQYWAGPALSSCAPETWRRVDLTKSELRQVADSYDEPPLKGHTLYGLHAVHGTATIFVASDIEPWQLRVVFLHEVIHAFDRCTGRGSNVSHDNYAGPTWGPQGTLGKVIVASGHTLRQYSDWIGLQW